MNWLLWLTTKAGQLIFKVGEGIRNREGILFPLFFWFCLCGGSYWKSEKIATIVFVREDGFLRRV